MCRDHGSGQRHLLGYRRNFAAHEAVEAMLESDASKVSEAATTITSTTEFASDVSEAESVPNIFQHIDEPMDILVTWHRARRQPRIDFSCQYGLALWGKARGAYLCMQSALQPTLPALQGVILNMASIPATARISDRFAYPMTKSTVLSMTLSIAEDSLSNGIRCNRISPVPVHTPFVDGFLAKDYFGQEAGK
jgi:2-keto-3-deoxy-L-fuconate dehydrogenase